MNRKSLALLFVALAALAALAARPTAAQPTPPAIQRGYSFAAWWSGIYSDPNADRALAELADMGVGWVSIVVTQYQDTVHSTAIAPTEGTPTDADVRHAIRAAHAEGLNVMLKPHVDLWNDPNHWRGEIGPNFTTAQWNTWFASYTAMITHYAQLAAEEGVEQFSVGTELNSTTGREAQWRAVIAAVGAEFDGTLTYAGDWTNALLVPWWDALDLIGVDAYYRLADDGNNSPTADEIAEKWQPVLADLAGLSAAEGDKPILFTEIGYRSQNGAAQHPWDWESGGAVDLAEQALLYQVAFEQVADEPWFAGFYWWSWDAVPYQGGVCDNGYTVHDKPAEDVVRQWYGAPPRDTTPPPPPVEAVALPIYGDAPAAGWENWSWQATVNFNQSAQVQSGTKAILVDAQSWGALSLHYESLETEFLGRNSVSTAPYDSLETEFLGRNSVSTAPYYYLSFYLRQAAVTNALIVYAQDENGDELLDAPAADCRYVGGTPLPANTWRRVLIPLADLGAADGQISQLTFVNTGDASLRFWIDDLRLVAADESAYLPIVLSPTDDAYVQSNSPNGKFGSKPALRVRDAAADNLSYLKFDVTGLSGPPSSATLRLYVSDAGPDGGAVYSVANTYRNSAAPWTEAGLRWGNAPAIGGAALDAAGAVARKAWVEWDVTAAVGGNGPVSFALRNASANVVAYNSSEGARPPELVIER